MPGQNSEIVSRNSIVPYAFLGSVMTRSLMSSPKNISPLRSSSDKSAESQRMAASRIHSYLQDPSTSVPYAKIVKDPQASIHKQLNRVAAAGYRMGTMLEEFDKAFDGNTSGCNNDFDDRNINGS
ncbi:hypothetical protein BOTNAR_0194g00060 [Botryotinia narcissicola]|uniref:Uncharacterized protein n=1 Tax=Botryotinia narcissicola TaxID=278944 RepID=A0A4Z1IAY3_9HELO|nr:hypothetical protein BOTNAR_0194g00060 [Botryotinia narcissicola]